MKYQELIENFSWEEVKKYYDGDPDGIINFANEVCDRWADDPNRIAIYWEDKLGNTETWTYKRLKEQTNRVANAFRSLGIKKGDRVAGLLGKDMELVTTIIATWKIGAIYVPLFTAFGPDAVMHRINDSQVNLLVTNREQASKLDGENLSFQVLLADGLTEGGRTFWEFIGSFPAQFEIEQTDCMDPCVIQYTSGSTGLPKGSIATHKGIYNLYPYLKYALNIEEGDIFFGGADLGWSYGLMACTFGPLSQGVKTVMYKGPFEVEKVYQILEKYEVTNFTYAPTAYRMMMAAGEETLEKIQN